MPEGLTVPAWYNDNNYINEKVNECNTIKFGAVEGEEFVPWTADSVREFMAGVNQEASYAPWMGYDNFVESGNAENCSPNPLFDVMQYVTAKAAQLNSINYDGRNADNNPWTAQAVLDYFKAHNITAWDHFTTAGQFENVNPSNAMDLSDFLANKAKECNDIEFDGKTDWTPESVLAYYQEHGLNAVMVAVSASDPNVVAVPQDDQVTPPAGFTPWGVAATPVDIELTTGVDVIPASDAPINYIGTIVNTNSSSTLNPNDQINGGNAADELTVNMDRSWIGFNDGFVKGVPTVNLNNETVSGRNLNFNAENIEGVDTWNVNGNVSLSNLEKAGITVNLSNVNGDNPYNLNFDADAVKGGNDSLTLGISNMPEYVTVNGNGIEHVTVNSTGDVENYVWLKGMDGAKSVKIIGDTESNVALSPTVTTIDATEAGADTFVCTRYSDLVESIRMGNGDDSFTLRSLTPDAVVDGGDGQDSAKLYNTSGAYQLQMSNVETLNITVAKNYAGQAAPDPTASLSLDGGLTTGLETLGLIGGNGYAIDGTKLSAPRAISLSNYDMGDLTVNVTKTNYVDLSITDIEDITINVGDGRATDAANNVPLDQLTGVVTLPDVENVAINITDINNPGNAKTEFNAALVAGNADNLSLTSGQYSGININGGDLSNVSQLTIAGYYDTTIQNANLSQDVKSVYVDAQGQIGGKVTTAFGGNQTKGGASLNYAGSTTGENLLTVDNTYSAVNVATGINDDVLTISGLAADGTPWTTSTLTGNLGSGTDKIVVTGPAYTMVNGQRVWSNFSAFTGVESVVFTDPDMVGTVIPSKYLPAGASFQVQPVFDVTGKDTETGTPGDDSFVLDITPDSTGGDVVLGGAGGNDTVSGTVNNAKTNLTVDGGTGSVNVAFGPGSDQLDVQDAATVTVNGGTGTDDGSEPNNITGTIDVPSAPVNVNTAEGSNAGTGNIDLTVGTAGNVTVNGFNGEGSTYDVTVTNAANVDLNSGNAANAQIEVQNATGTVNATTGTGDDTVTVQNAASTVTVNTGDGNDTVSVQDAAGAVNVDSGKGDDEVTVDVTNNANNPTISTGDGDDTITVNIASEMTTAITLNPGEGKDTINVLTADNAARAAAQSGAAESVTLTCAVTAEDTLNIDLTGTNLDLSGLTGTYTQGVTLQGTDEASTLTGGDGNDVLISGPVSFGWPAAAAGAAKPGDAVFTLAGTPDWTKAGTVVFDPDGAAGKADPITVAIDALSATDAATLAEAIAAAKFDGFTVTADGDTVTVTQSDASKAATDITGGATLEVYPASTKGSVEFTLAKAAGAGGEPAWDTATKVIFDPDGSGEADPLPAVTIDASSAANATDLAGLIAAKTDEFAGYTVTNTAGVVTFTQTNATDEATAITKASAPTLTIQNSGTPGSVEFTFGKDGGTPIYTNAKTVTFDPDGAEGEATPIPVDLTVGSNDVAGLVSKIAAGSFTGYSVAANGDNTGVIFTQDDLSDAATAITSAASLEVEDAGTAGKAIFKITDEGSAAFSSVTNVVFDPNGSGDAGSITITVTSPTNLNDILNAIAADQGLKDAGFTATADTTNATITIVQDDASDTASDIAARPTLKFNDASGEVAKIDEALQSGVGESNATVAPGKLQYLTDSSTPTPTSTTPSDVANLAETAGNIVDTLVPDQVLANLTSEKTGGSATIPAPGAVEAQEGVTDTLTGGKGDDTFVVQLAATAINAETVTPNVTPNPTVIITDFGTGEETKGNDTLVFGSSAGSTTAVSATTDATDYGSVAALVQAALTALDGTNNAFIGTSGGNTYVAYGAQAGQMTALVQLTGVTIGNVDAADIFVGAAGA